MERARHVALSTFPSTGALPGGEPTALEFFTRLAADHRRPSAYGEPREAEDADLAVIARLAAPLFGDRPLAGITLGELAGLPAMLEARGMTADASRLACRALGSALRTAILALPNGRRPS